MSQLAVRIVSGVAMAALLIGDVWLGGWWFAVLLGIGASIVLAEYLRLVMGGFRTLSARLAWFTFGIAYVFAALNGLWFARSQEQGLFAAMLLFGAVWAIDIGAYAAGRTIGGPRIAPRISPNKTWAGLFGGFLLCTIFVFSAVSWQIGTRPWEWGFIMCALGAGACFVLTMVAQLGDFFESWLKRRAGMKDSGTLIPGHGGLFDRVDGLLPVAALFPVIVGIVVG